MRFSKAKVARVIDTAIMRAARNFFAETGKPYDGATGTAQVEDKGGDARHFYAQIDILDRLVDLLERFNSGEEGGRRRQPRVRGGAEQKG